ncbi:MAG: hypothetical protein HJJLKODD_02881 [Phycisphaerae bacterium]|nr:hypothetical protein [Phycisphaerae bacterium]
MGYFNIGLPLFSCQVQLHGGLRRLSLHLMIYAFISVSLAVGYRLIDHDSSLVSVADNMQKWLGWGQVILLVAVGTSALVRALYRDNTTRMMESHRSSPMSAFNIIIGYLIGSTFRVLLFFLFNLLAGFVLCILSHNPTAAWLSGNCCLFLSSLAIWSAALFLLMHSSKRSGAFSILFLLLSCAGPALITLLPAFGLLTGLCSGAWSVMGMTGTLPNRGEMGISLVATACMVVYWIFAAIRRFRHPALPILSVNLTMVLILFWWGASVIGLVYRERLMPPMFTMEQPDIIVQVICAVVVPLFLLAITIVFGQQHQPFQLKGARLTNPLDRLSQFPLVVLAVLNCCVGLLLLWVTAKYRTSWSSGEPILFVARPYAYTIAAYGTMALISSGSFRVSYNLTRSTKFGWLLVLPILFLPIIDFVRVMFLTEGDPTADAFGRLLVYSPLGTLIQAWMNSEHLLVEGLIVQAIAAAILCVLGLRNSAPVPK